jgi:hypothetical protein
VSETVESVGGRRQMAIEIKDKTVTLSVSCSDAYEARVLHDDLIDRLKAGETIDLSFTPKSKVTPR